MKKINYRKILVSHIIVLLIGFIIGVLMFSADINFNNKEAKLNSLNKIINGTNINEKRSGSVNIVAITNNGFGIIGKVNADIVDGDGRVLVNTNPFIEPDTQYSAVTAVNVAKNLTNADLNKKNIIIDFKVSNVDIEHQGVIGGPSAGIAMTLAVLSAIENKEVKNIGITGAILPDGTIGEVGGILEKADAVADNNLTLFLIPEGQGTFTYYERQIRTKNISGVKISKAVLIPKKIDVVDYYAKERNLTIIEVDNINEVLDYAF